MQTQLDIWQGEFGKAYTDRNPVRWEERVPSLREMIDGLSLRSVLEVGCNRGHNLLALAELLGSECNIVGIEPNRYALQIARQSSAKIGVLEGNIYDLPFKNGAFDLVMTAGVLIHIPPEDLALAMRNVYRTSARYLLAIEYFADQETVIPYRGHSNLLWKRDFGAHYQHQFPDLKLLSHASRSAEPGADETDWWLFEKGTLERG